MPRTSFAPLAAVLPALLPICATAVAGTTPATPGVTQQVLRAAREYARSVSCVTDEPGVASVAALVPYTSQRDFDKARYAVLWRGDMGCMGGPDADRMYLAMVEVRADGSFRVASEKSSPFVKFQPLASNGLLRVVDSSADTLVLEGTDTGEKDSVCCSPVRITLHLGERGNWSVVGEQQMRSQAEPPSGGAASQTGR